MDYKRFNIKDRKIMKELFINSNQANDEDNSNTIHDTDNEVTYMRVSSNNGIAHQVLVNIVNVWPVPIIQVEEHAPWRGLRWSVWRVDFYGAFFHFMDYIPKRYVREYEKLTELHKNEPENLRTTRKDVSLDFIFDFPQKGNNWIKPSPNSMRDVISYKHEWKYNSFGYLSNKNSGYGVRIYNKRVDVLRNRKWWKANKSSWYGWIENIPENWTRIEFEFYPPYSLMSDEELIKICWERCTWSTKVNLWLKFRPKATFEIERAYNYFQNYAENHWITMEELMDQIITFHCYLEEKKEFYWLIEENI